MSQRRRAPEFRGSLARFFERQSEPLEARYRLGQRREPQMQRGEHKSSGKQGKRGRYACQKGRSPGIAQHRKQGETEENIADGKHHILPAILTDQQ